MCEAEARSNRYKKRKAAAIEHSVSRRRQAAFSFPCICIDAVPLFNVLRLSQHHLCGML